MGDIRSSRCVRRGCWKWCRRCHGVLMIGGNRGGWTHSRARGGAGRGDFRGCRGIMMLLLMVMVMGSIHVHCIRFFFGCHTSRCGCWRQWHGWGMLIALDRTMTIKSMSRQVVRRTWCDWRSLNPGEKSMEVWRQTRRDRKQWKGKCRRSQHTRGELKANDARHANAKQRKHSDEDRFVDTSSDRETGKRSLIVFLFFLHDKSSNYLFSICWHIRAESDQRSKRKTCLTTGLDATIDRRRPTDGEYSILDDSSDENNERTNDSISMKLLTRWSIDCDLFDD